MDRQLPVVFLMGATATGKTALAIELYKRNPDRFELISVDSTLIYRGMNIGTAKPTAQELAEAPHHLIDIIDPQQSYSVGSFYRDACELIDQAHQAGKIPLLVGGTMLYFRSFFALFNDLPTTKPEIRDYVSQLIEQDGVLAIHEMLDLIDPTAASKIEPQDKQRIGRVVEVYLQTGKAISELYSQTKIQHPYQIMLFAMADERQLIHQRIATRVDQMMAQGLLNEVIELRKNPLLNNQLASIRAVGYRQVWDYLDGNLSEAELVPRIVYATRQLAKRQITWLRSWPEEIKYLPLTITGLELAQVQQHNVELIEQSLANYLKADL